jgi:hypothetical protein
MAVMMMAVMMPRATMMRVRLCFAGECDERQQGCNGQQNFTHDFPLELGDDGNAYIA